ncbi:50S ribosomal protein L21 [Buchnera aphidicola]|uniref:50S ribosomal protein L21 n=1 Tax=Buchnera aphidicola TaxID=9 RepID=UPI0030EF3B38
MYAIFSNGGKQYKVCIGQVIKLEKIKNNSNKKIKFDKILMISSKKKVFLGQPFLKNAYIKAKILMDGKCKKINIIKFKRRKHYKKKQGHRQNFTSVKIKNIKIIS